MERTRLLTSILMLGFIASAVLGQGCGLSTSFLDNNACRGNFFDVVGVNPAGVTIQSFDINLAVSTTATVSVYYVTAGGTYVGNETNSAAWTLAGSATVTSQGAQTPTPLPVTIGVMVPPGGTQGFLVHTPGTIRYISSVVPLGTILAQDANLQILSGHGHCSTPVFSLGNAARDWCGTIYYSYPGQVVDWETNKPTASVDINGAVASPCSPAVISETVTTCIGAPTTVSGTLNVSSLGNPGALHEMVYNSAPVVSLSGAGIALPPGNEILNLNVTSPFSYVNGGAALDLLPLPGSTFPGSTGGAYSAAFVLTPPVTISIQGVFTNPAVVGGIELTQATEFSATVVPAATSIPGPTADDTNLIIDVTASPTCWFPSGVSFNGTTYTSIAISPNGRILFSSVGDTDFSPTVVEALADEPFLGYWTDFTPPSGGTITINNPTPGVLRADFNAVVYIGEVGAPNTFGIEIDDISQIFSLDGLGGIVPNPITGGTAATSDAQFLGMSVGLAGGATDPGATTFSAGGGGPAIPNATDMLYDYYDYVTGVGGLVGSLATPGLSEIQFNYISGVGFLWTGL